MNRLLCIAFLAATVAPPAQAEGLWLYWPVEVVQPARDLAIRKVNISVACGQFQTIRNIPDDWSLKITPTIGTRATLNAAAHHGASRLDSMDGLNGTIRISVDDPACFDVKARLTTFAGTRTYTRTELQLRKEPQDVVLIAHRRHAR